LIFLRDDAVAVLAIACRVDELAFFLFRMTGQAGFRLDLLWFNEGMLDTFFGANRQR
jgi:hypothetical protein